jgi:hypothetical protein
MLRTALKNAQEVTSTVVGRLLAELQDDHTPTAATAKAAEAVGRPTGLFGGKSGTNTKPKKSASSKTKKSASSGEMPASMDEGE